MSRLSLPIAAVLALAFAAPAARASLRLCNRTSTVLYAATAVSTGPDIAVAGWTRIVPGACSVAIKGDLTAAAYYLYARSSSATSGAPRAWGGTVDLCVKDTNFSLRLPRLSPGCPSPDMSALGFVALATHHMRSWTTTFRETPDFDSMKSAERAGLKRLLREAGARIATLDASSDKTVDAAIADFRKRVHLSDKASTADLFDALETDVMKTAAPAGYSVCNDTDKPIWAAIGQKAGNAWKSRGWWQVAPGACARTMTESVANRRIDLRVEKAKGVALVSGPEKFCVADIEFEIQGRQNCAARGLIEAGFAETNLQGSPGFAAHVAGNGLAPIFSTGTGMSK